MSAEERAAEIAELNSLIDTVASADIATLPSEVLLEIDEAAAELERLSRIHRCETDLLEFAIEYFSEARNPGNLGNWDGFDITNAKEAPDFHKEICEIMDNVSNVEVNAKIAVAAPRSHGKSTYLSKAFPLREAVFRKRKYCILISETPTVASNNLDWISSQLKHNAKLRKDFGVILAVSQQENIRDNSTEFIAKNPEFDTKVPLLRVEAASTGGAIRGRNWEGYRPDLIVCDDLEDVKTNAATPELRTKMKDWFSQSVMPLGDPAGKRTAIVYMGTTVHHDALLVKVLTELTEFKARVYRAIIEYPERMDLWEACRLVYKDAERSKEERRADALALYELNREEMDKGAKVLWSEFQSLWKLMTWKWDYGSKAFNTEYMNNPIDEDSMIFNPEKFTYWDGGNIASILTQYPRPTDEFEIYTGIDFAMGKQRGDYSAIVTIAKHRVTGAIFVLDAWGERVKPDAFLRVITEKVTRFQPDHIAAEAQAAQEFFVQKLKESLQAVGYPARTRVKEIYQRSRKELRIEAMLPDIESGAIQFTKRHALLLEQFEQYGTGSHDDVIDALEMAVSISKTSRRKVRNKPAIFYK